MSQSYPVAEVIIVDDASNPQEVSAVRNLVADHSDVQLVELENNSGPGNARNVGWSLARSEWVAFLDSDDAWRSDKLEKQLSAAYSMQNLPTLIASSSASFEQVGTTDPPEVLPVRALRKIDVLLRNPIATSTVLVKRTHPDRFDPDRRFAEDYELWLTIIGRGEEAILLQNDLSIHFKEVVGESGLSARIWRMIGGEYRAFWNAYRRDSLNSLELIGGLSMSTVRSAVRLSRLAIKRIILR